MTSLARYHGRAPRYILNTQDDYLVRVAGPKQVPWEEGTEILNVSLTGLAFTAPSDLCPLLGEVIKIQFTPPGGQQMACYAIVTRLESKSDQLTLVGVHFYKLEMSQRIVLAQGLAKKFNARGVSIDDLAHEYSTLKFWPQFLIMLMSGVSWGIILYLLMRYDFAEILGSFLN